MMRRLVDQVHRVAVALPRGLAEVVLAAGGQLCGPGITEVRIVRPNDDSGQLSGSPREMVERVVHVTVPQVPR